MATLLKTLTFDKDEKEKKMGKEELLKKAFDSIVEADEDEAMASMDMAAEAGIDNIELLNDGFSAGRADFCQ